jgi:NADH-quinone oxidoreductase subunit M
MPEYDLILMSLVIFLPSLFGIVALCLPSKFSEGLRWWGLLGTACTLALSLCMFLDFYAMLDRHLDSSGKPLRGVAGQLTPRVEKILSADIRDVPEPRKSDDWVARVKWIERFNIYYCIGLDGFNMPLVLLTCVVCFLSMLASWRIEKNLKAYLALLLFLQTGVLGTFMSLDLFLFFVFYEVMLLPMYFLIGLWGGGRRKYAAIKFVIYTLLGSVFILIAMISLYFVDVRDVVDQNQVKAIAEAQHVEKPQRSVEELASKVSIHTFDMVTLQKMGQLVAAIRYGNESRIVAAGSEAAKNPENLPLLAPGVNREQAIRRIKDSSFASETMQLLVFGLLFIGFAVKVPIFPLHSWLPDAHVEAPTPISMILAGVLLKLGGYGIIRLAYPICPWAAEQLSLVVGIFGAFCIIYGALVAMGQTDFKKLLAYSSISHMGYVILGFAVWSAHSESQFWSWGLNGAMYQMIAHGITAAGLFFVVGVVYERAHHREINQFGGLMNSMPLYGGLSAFLFFGSMGLPALCGFIGEVFVVFGAWKFNPWLGFTAIVCTVLTAGYLLWCWQRVFLGVNANTSNYPDLTLNEMLTLVPFVLLTIALGILPQSLILNWMEPSISHLAETLTRLKG